MPIMTLNEIDLKNIDLDLRHLFGCIYREQRLTQAGLRLNRTQSAINHGLERLRTLLPDLLFVRIEWQIARKILKVHIAKYFPIGR
ncbi:MAG TPA: LysR family transcriptional regulator [Candidatus Handelsmanbacteria bacterium]|nr:LysR family transcriptional regulator [Candidatus Handelsmanbacteria bacterium]